MMMGKRVAVVMGGGGGIGSVICRQLAGSGIQVVVNDINETRAKQCADALVKMGHRPLVLIGDVCQKAEVQRMKAEVEREFRGADILVNSQAVLHLTLLINLSEDGWRDTLSVHLDGTLNSMQAFAPMMIERKYGRIVNISSIAARWGFSGASYAAAKSGIEGLTRTAALEWAKYGITANCVAPGAINAGMTLQASEKFKTFVTERAPMKRMGEAEEVAACVCFLASEKASFITGQTIYVCGGLSIV
jgi:3-oxoacyl-[acyl-carrier protein] reductase